MFVLENYGQTPSMTIQGSLRKDPKLVRGLPETTQPTVGNLRPVCHSTPRWWWILNWELVLGYERPIKSLSSRPRSNRMVSWSRDGPSMALPSVKLCFAQATVKLRGEVVISPNFQIKLLVIP